MLLRGVDGDQVRPHPEPSPPLLDQMQHFVEFGKALAQQQEELVKEMKDSSKALLEQNAQQNRAVLDYFATKLNQGVLAAANVMPKPDGGEGGAGAAGAAGGGGVMLLQQPHLPIPRIIISRPDGDLGQVGGSSFSFQKLYTKHLKRRKCLRICF